MTDKKTDKKIVISKQSAEEQFALLLDYYEIEKDTIELDQGPEAMQTLINQLVGAIMRGRLEITIEGEDIKVIQTLRHPPGEITQIVYGRAGSAAKRAMDAINPKRSFDRMCAYMGVVSKEGSSALGKLEGVDAGTMERLATLFIMA